MATQQQKKIMMPSQSNLLFHTVKFTVIQNKASSFEAKASEVAVARNALRKSWRSLGMFWEQNCPDPHQYQSLSVFHFLLYFLRIQAFT